MRRPAIRRAFTQPTGTVLAGTPSLLLAGISPAFSADGGWVIIGNGEVIVRYTGISGNNLIGIPPTGVGSITTSISYGSLATAAPQLLGIPASGAGAIIYPLISGDNINLLVTVDDVAAQAALAGLIGGSGIKEAYIQDRPHRLRRGRRTRRGHARRAGRTAHRGALRLPRSADAQRRDDSLRAAAARRTSAATTKSKTSRSANFSAKPGQPPTYTVQASSQRYSLDDLLRMARGTIGA